MKETDKYSDEFLNAFIDGELHQEDRDRLLSALQHDTALNARLEQLRKLHDMVQLAYADVKAPPQGNAPARRFTTTKVGLSLAAGLLLGIGVTVGWLASQQLNRPHTPAQIARHLPPGATHIDGKPVWRVVMHVNTVDTYLQNTLLEETENLLEAFEDTEQQVQVEIVAYGPGLNLLRRGTSAYADRIQSLQKRYTNLSFTACERSLKRIATLENTDVELLPHVQTAPSGLREIIKRQKEGWNYIRI
jgi:intracellular sulfur oxidation DsrE/DsrF family protein